MNHKVKIVLNGILTSFGNGNIPEAVALASYPVPNTNIPSANWSFRNRTLMFLAGTGDARGIRQWNKINRRVKKGAKAFSIIVPCMFKKENEDDEKVCDIKGFVCTPVFRYEDTVGEKLECMHLEPPDLPFMERAKEWGISIKAIPGNYRCYGYYSSSRKEIGLASPEETVFFHELAHASHEKVKGSLKSGQNPFQEIVAELSAHALCWLVGKSGQKTLGNAYRYIEKYAKKIEMSPISACIKVMSDTEKVLGLILKREKTINNIEYLEDFNHDEISKRRFNLGSHPKK